jgi:tripartite ATP-independent transporter DctM subunit
VISAIRSPRLAPRATISIPWKEKISTLKDLWPIIVLVVVIVGTIYGGICTPNEAAAIAALVALVLAFARKGLSWRKLGESLLDSASVSCMIFLILIGSDIFARFLSICGFNNLVAMRLVEMHMSPLGFVISVMILYLIMGCFIDWVPGLAITIPLFLDPLKALDVNLIWFGVLAAVSMQLGTITPPFGIVTFATKAAAGDDVTVDDVYKGSLPFWLMMLGCLAILIAFPKLSLLIPNAMVR